MSDKVKLTKEQADIIGDLISEGKSTIVHTIAKHSVNSRGWNKKNLEPLNGIPLDTLIRALYIGYEVESTPEEMILNEYLRSDTGDKTDMAYQNGMEYVLCALGMIIPRIND